MSIKTPSHRQPAPKEGLTGAQRTYLEWVPSFLRREMAEHLAARAETIILRQDELTSEEQGSVPAYALALAEDPEFWFGCFDSPELAQAKALELGLRLTDHSPS